MSVSKCSLTRSKVECPIFGNRADLNPRMLPTIEQILRSYLFIRYKLKYEKHSGKEPSFLEVCNELVPKIENIWKMASIPTVSKDRVVQLIQKYHEKYTTLIRYPKSKRNNSYYEKVNNLKIECHEKLFDIAACKCDFSACKCKKTRKVPSQEQQFLSDQRSIRKMCVGNVDHEETKKILCKEQRQSIEIKKLNKYKSESCNLITPSCSSQTTTLLSESESNQSKYESSSDDDFIDPNLPSTSKTTQIKINLPTNQMRIKLPTLGLACDKYGISDRSAAAIASAVLKDVGIITAKDSSKIVDKNKVRRVRKKTRNTLRKEFQSANRRIKSLYFDGRKDKTLLQEMKNDRFYKRSVVEEHISLIEEPDALYIGHVTPSTGTAKSIGKAILDFLAKNNLELGGLEAVGCDGTVVNTGNKNGVIRYIETELKRPLQWYICQLHANELPLRHLFQNLDGNTVGPRQFSGEIGKSLEKCEHLEIVSFTTIKCELPKITVMSSDLSSDQSYLYDICNAISSGNFSTNLANRNPGKLAHSRWLTMANRVLRLYAGTDKPTSNLTDIAEFIIKVYAPMWFNIKLNSSSTSGSLHVFKTIKLSRYLRGDLKSIVDAVIQRNAYFIHPENILLCMLADTRQCVRELSVQRILKARQTYGETVQVRKFVVPKINFSATDYFELIYWSECDVTPPPVLRDITDDDLMGLINKSDIPDFEFRKFPCHTQSVERCVKLVTESSSLVIGPESRDSFIRSRIKSKEIIPTFENKQQFKIE